MATAAALSSSTWSSSSIRIGDLKHPISLDDLTDVFEADAEDEDMFLAGLGGKEQVFECLINGVCNQHPELVLCIETEEVEGNATAAVVFHLAYIKKGDGLQMVTFSFTVLNLIIRMCLFPLLGDGWNASVAFLEDIYVPGGSSTTAKEYKFDVFIRETFKNFLYTTTTEEQAPGDAAAEEEEGDGIDRTIPPHLKGMILEKDEVDMLMDNIGVDKMRCGVDQSAMIRCTNEGHEDTNPSMSVKLIAMAWRLSDKLEVSEELDEKLCELYRGDRRDVVDDRFVFISDNAVKDLSSGRVYVLYIIKKYCFSCRNKC